MQKTKNLKLNKPEYGDVADVADLNANMDILDTEVANKAAASHTHNNGADLTNVNAAKLGGREPSAYALDGNLKTVAKTGNYNDLTNKPTTMPANGGNADTVDGKHASDFAACSVISSGDFNSMVTTGLYAMRSCTNAPSTEKNYYGLIVLKSDNGSCVEQMAFMEGTVKVYVRYLKSAAWSEWEEIGNKYAEKLRIFDVDGSTLKDTDGTNNLVAATPKKISEAEARITGFGTDKYWYNLGISNQTMKVPYSDMAIRALSFGSGAIPADTGMVRNVEGISENIMNDCAFPVSYVTRVSNTPFSPISGQQFHLIYLPSTHNWSETQEDTTGYGTQIAIGLQAFPTTDWDKAPFSRGLQIYMRSGATRKRFADDSDTNKDYANELNLKFSGNENIKDMNKYPYIATGWSNWVKINTAENITTTYVNAANGNYAVNISASNVQNAILKLAEQICSAKSSAGTLSSSLNSHTGATNSAHTSSAISVDAITSTTYGDNTLTTGKSNVLNVLKDIYNRLAYSLYREDNINDTLKTHRTAETRSGSKHIPSGGSWNKTLKYSESGTAVWTPSPYTYQKIEQSIVYNKWYKLALCNFSSGHRYGGGFAIITVTAYNSSGKGQTVVCRTAYSGGTGDFQLLHSVCRDENSKVFDKVSYVRLNYGFIAFHAAANISDITMNITVESSISEERVDFKANDNEWDTTDDGSWVWTHSGQHYWNDIDL